jgi:hypothetical protein
MLKLSLSLFFIAVLNILCAQPFFPLSENSSKDFAPFDETWERNYSLHIDSASIGDVIAVFYLDRVKNENAPANFTPEDGDPESCFGWGGCQENSGSMGFGTRIVSPVPHVYQFYTQSNDTLSFDFASDSAVFYTNDFDIFSIISEGESLQMTFGVAELVQSFRVSHYSNEGDEIDSPLNGFVIRTGVNSGLIDFFEVDNFPNQETPLTLIGDADLEESLGVLTTEMVYDFQIGDTIQYRMTYFESEPDNPDFTNEISYLNQIIQNRIDEVDSLRYTVLYQSFDQNETNLNEWSEEQVYYRFDTLSSLPFYRTRNNGGFQDGSYQENLFRRDFCGERKIGLSAVSEPFVECEEYDAWCSFDTNGPPEITRVEYLPGLGRYFHQVERLGFGAVNTWRETTEIIYFSKAGNSCGQEAILSDGTLNNSRVDFSVFPNPSSDRITVRVRDTDFTLIRLMDLTGRTVSENLSQGSESNINISELASGTYLIQLVNGSIVLGVSKLVVQ